MLPTLKITDSMLYADIATVDEIGQIEGTKLFSFEGYVLKVRYVKNLSNLLLFIFESIAEIQKQYTL